MRFQKVLLLLIYFIVMLIVASQISSAAVEPLTVNYHGTLTDNTDTPVNSTKTMRFSLYRDGMIDEWSWSCLARGRGLLSLLAPRACPESVRGRMEWKPAKEGKTC